MSNQKLLDQKEKLMSRFDFKRVEKVYEFLNWSWAGRGIPGEIALRECASQLLNYAIRAYDQDPDIATAAFATGGLAARLMRYKEGWEGTLGEPHLELVFECEWVRNV